MRTGVIEAKYNIEGNFKMELNKDKYIIALEQLNGVMEKTCAELKEKGYGSIFESYFTEEYFNGQFNGIEENEINKTDFLEFVQFCGLEADSLPSLPNGYFSNEVLKGNPILFFKYEKGLTKARIMELKKESVYAFKTWAKNLPAIK